MAVTVITGASRGIGRALAIAFAEEGSDIVAVARDGRRLEELGEVVHRVGGRYVGLEVDLGTRDGPAQAAEQALAWQGEVTALVNVAGLVIREPEASLRDLSVWDQTIALNARAPYVLMEALGRPMFDQGRGAIVNVASIAGQLVTRAPAPYQASKAALIQLTRYYAVKFAPAVRVNAVGPGYVRTDLTKSWLALQENENWVRERTPMGRIGVPEDIVGSVLFLASDRAAYITGQHLLVDGGWSVV